MADSFMIERLVSEGAIGCSAAADVIATVRGGSCHPATAGRYCLRGIRLPGGRIVKLEHFSVSGRLMTSKAAIFRFIAAQQQQAETAEPTTIPLPTPTERRRAIEAAARELDAAGA